MAAVIPSLIFADRGREWGELGLGWDFKKIREGRPINENVNFHWLRKCCYDTFLNACSIQSEALSATDCHDLVLNGASRKVVLGDAWAGNLGTECNVWPLLTSRLANEWLKSWILRWIWPTLSRTLCQPFWMFVSGLFVCGFTKRAACLPLVPNLLKTPNVLTCLAFFCARIAY